jgi:stage V sporulation protein R
VLDYDQMNEIAAYGGFPTRYPHWRFGMEYEQLAKSYEYGLSKIYEMVINNNPSYAYLLEGNSLTDQKLVMAHVSATSTSSRTTSSSARPTSTPRGR